MSEEFLSSFAKGLDTLKNQINKVWHVLDSAPPGLSSGTGRPGCIIPYELPEYDCTYEMTLSPAAKFAVKESTRGGPLNESDLVGFLDQKFDRRSKNTVDIIHIYSEDVEGVKNQLVLLRNRIEEIESADRQKSDFIHKIIRRILAALKYTDDLEEVESMPDYQSPDSSHIEEFMTPALKLVLAETGKKGPLNENNLKSLLCDKIDTGYKNNLSIIYHYTDEAEDLKIQLEHFIDKLDSIEFLENFRNNWILAQISKVLGDLQDERFD